MQELSVLSKKCLSNMPMMVDIISATINNLRFIFTPINEDIKKFLEKLLPALGYQIDYTKVEEEVINVLPNDNEGVLFPKIELSYAIPFIRTYRNKTYYFFVYWGYQAEEDNNIIYYQLYDDSDSLMLDDTVKDAISEKIPEEWKFNQDDRSIWIEFDIDEALSVEKIRKCANDFKDYILNPFIDILKA